VRRLASLILLALAAVAVAPAQGGLDLGMTDSSIAPMPTRLEVIASMLKLNRDQTKQVKTILDAAQKEAAPVRDGMKTGRSQIAAAVVGGKPQPEIDAAVKGYADAAARMAGLEVKAFIQIYQGMSPDQRKSMDKLYSMMGGIFIGKNWNVNVATGGGGGGRR
jgi:Spy/CpxP family protein refolding chaperone